MGPLRHCSACDLRARISRTAHARAAAVLLGVCLAILPLAASAQSAGSGEPSVRVRWLAASGPVEHYEVWVSINDGRMELYGEVSETQVEVFGPQFQLSDSLRFEVVAVSADGRRGTPSETSNVIFFGTVPVPQNLTVHDGSALDPNHLSWDPVPGADFYLVFRAPEGSAPQLWSQSSDPSLDDATAPLNVRHTYVVAAVSGRQVSAYSAPVTAIRGGNRPKLVASVASLTREASRSEGVVTDTFELTNAGDWKLSWAAWVFGSWIDVTPENNLLDEGVQRVTVSYRVDKLALGVHDTVIRIYTYYDPPPGESFQLGPPLEIPIRLTVRDAPPTIDLPASLSVGEGLVVDVPVHASDSDPGSDVQMGLVSGPPFASLTSLGGGDARLTIAPGAGTAGTYTITVSAWDRNFPSVPVQQSLELTVGYVNNAPVVQAIPTQTAKVGETSGLTVYATDPDGDRIALTTSTLPDFVNFDGYTNGVGRFTFAPEASDVGSYLLILAVVDDGVPSRFVGVPFQLTVVP